jgi:hypothetical protein
MSDGIALGRWSLGCFDTVMIETMTYRGEALDGRGLTYVRIRPDRERLQVVYEVGKELHSLNPRILAVIVPTTKAGGTSEESCLVSLIGWRTSEMSNADWKRLEAFHDAEILLIKSQIEAAARS